MVKPGYKQTEIGVIPEDWADKKLGDVGKVCMCKRIFADQTSDTGEIPFFKIGTFGKEADAYISRELYEDFKRRFSYPQKGDVLISAAGTLGRSVVFDGKDSYFQDSNIVWLDLDKEQLCNEYLYHYYKVIQWASSEGSTIARLYNGIICNTHIAVPDVEEQKKIANVLSDVDELIFLTEKQLSKKKAIKQGAMQELLTGKTRINGFNSAWKQTTIREIATIFGRIGFRGYTKNDLVEPYKGAISLSPSNIVNSKLNLNNLTFISWEKYNESPEIMLEVGDVILVKTGSTFGKSTYIDNCKWKITLNPQIVVFKRIKVNSRLFGYIVQSKEFQNQIAATVVGGAIPTLSQEQIYNFEVNIPVDEMEQLAISSFLSDLDEEIEALEQKLAKYRQVKQGMMQQLLTGKIRLV